MRSDHSLTGQESGARPARTFIEEARRAQLIDAAIAVLSTSGYEAASLARIAEQAGVSKGVVSYHFDGKDELFAELVGRVRTAAAEFMVPRLGEAPTAVAWLGTYVRTNLAFMAIRRDMLTALVEVIVHTPPPNPYRAVHLQTLRHLEAMLHAGQARGELGQFDPAVFAMAMRGAIDAIPARLKAEPDLDLDACGDELAALFERAAEVRP